MMLPVPTRLFQRRESHLHPDYQKEAMETVGKLGKRPKGAPGTKRNETTQIAAK